LRDLPLNIFQHGNALIIGKTANSFGTNIVSFFRKIVVFLRFIYFVEIIAGHCCHNFHYVFVVPIFLRQALQSRKIELIAVRQLRIFSEIYQPLKIGIQKSRYIFFLEVKRKQLLIGLQHLIFNRFWIDCIQWQRNKTGNVRKQFFRFQRIFYGLCFLHRLQNVDTAISQKIEKRRLQLIIAISFHQQNFKFQHICFLKSFRRFQWSSQQLTDFIEENIFCPLVNILRDIIRNFLTLPNGISLLLKIFCIQFGRHGIKQRFFGWIGDIGSISFKFLDQFGSLIWIFLQCKTHFVKGSFDSFRRII